MTTPHDQAIREAKERFLANCVHCGGNFGELLESILRDLVAKVGGEAKPVNRGEGWVMKEPRKYHEVINSEPLLMSLLYDLDLLPEQIDDETSAEWRRMMAIVRHWEARFNSGTTP
jgi:hypothetical protein